MSEQAPWLKHYGHIPHTLEYPDYSVFELLNQAGQKYPDYKAYEFQGKYVSYKTFLQEIDQTAGALLSLGIVPGDRVSICLPNIPQAIIMFYAVSRVGAVSNMIHPLSAEEEIKFYLNFSRSKVAITMDQFYPKFEKILEDTGLETLIITSVSDALSSLKSVGYKLTQGRKNPSIPKKTGLVEWKDFIKNQPKNPTFYDGKGHEPACILYSGGTTGSSKGISLTNRNFNALAMQTIAAGDCTAPGMSVLALMPVFHGFGLGISIHAMMTHGVCAILIPRFTPQIYVELLAKYKPNIIAGVPTLFESLLRVDGVEGLDLSCLSGMFSGGDSLPVETKRSVDALLKKCGAKIQVREGFGTTESVTANCLTPKDFHKEGSIGIPFPDTFFTIVRTGGQETLPYGEEGEICVSGPTVMQGYLDNPEETALALQTHPDGKVWLHTGDLGTMDEDGFVYFKQRLKRMIITSGYNVYPSQLEAVLNSHPAISSSVVIGVKDELKMQRIKAFIVLNNGYESDAETKKDIKEHCKKHIARYAMPSEFEFRTELPKTLIGKVAYAELEKEEAEKANAGS